MYLDVSSLADRLLADSFKQASEQEYEDESKVDFGRVYTGMKLRIGTHISICKTSNRSYQNLFKIFLCGDASPRRYSRIGGARISTTYNYNELRVRISGAEQ